ncbi:MAG: hypothetical protein GY850_47595 [bacterium]|nr:hypothetical protein [bacterium]
MGNLFKIWLSVPDDASKAELHDAFQKHFGAKWNEVLNAAQTSFAYNSINNAYFALTDLHPVGDLKLDQLLKKNGIDKPPNIIVS